MSLQVPRGNIWIQGDNIYNSRDSRTFGAVPYGLVEGKLFWRVSMLIRFPVSAYCFSYTPILPFFYYVKALKLELC